MSASGRTMFRAMLGGSSSGSYTPPTTNLMLDVNPIQANCRVNRVNPYSNQNPTVQNDGDIVNVIVNPTSYVYGTSSIQQYLQTSPPDSDYIFFPSNCSRTYTYYNENYAPKWYSNNGIPYLEFQDDDQEDDDIDALEIGPCPSCGASNTSASRCNTVAMGPGSGLKVEPNHKAFTMSSGTFNEISAGSVYVVAQWNESGQGTSFMNGTVVSISDQYSGNGGFYHRYDKNGDQLVTNAGDDADHEIENTDLSGGIGMQITNQRWACAVNEADRRNNNVVFRSGQLYNTESGDVDDETLENATEFWSATASNSRYRFTLGTLSYNSSSTPSGLSTSYAFTGKIYRVLYYEGYHNDATRDAIINGLATLYNV